MTTETIEPISAEVPQKINITSCLLSGLGVFGVFAGGSIIPWSGLVMGFTNLAWKNPALMLGAAVGSVVMFVCITAKPRSQLGKHGLFVENAAGVLALFSILWAAFSLVAWMAGSDKVPPESRYLEIMHLSPEQIDYHRRDGRMASNLNLDGKHELWVNKEDCQTIVKMSSPDMTYSLSVNGNTLGTCKSGLNVLEWNYKGN